MITIRREWLAKEGMAYEAIDNAKAYRDLFDASSSWRIHQPMTGQIFLISIEEDYESFAVSEEKWAERTSSPEWESWLNEWVRVTVSNTFVINYLNLN